jgi:hypothetical protein
MHYGYKIKVLMQNKDQQNGFIPLMIVLIAFVAAIIWLVYERVSKAHG